MILNNAYPYIKLERIDSPNGRKYVIPGGQQVASVTTILSKTKDSEHLDVWKKRIGEKKAKEVVDEAAALGTLMHEHLEAYTLGNEKTVGTNYNRLLAKKMSDVVIDKGLSNVSEAWGSEIQLHYDDLWAGTTDLTGTFNGKSAIMDFKTTLRPKKTEWITDYFLQISSYAMAHDRMFNTNIECGVIFMVSRDLTYQEFVIEGDELEKYKTAWAERVSVFYQT